MRTSVFAEKRRSGVFTFFGLVQESRFFSSVSISCNTGAISKAYVSNAGLPRSEVSACKISASYCRIVSLSFTSAAFRTESVRVAPLAK